MELLSKVVYYSPFCCGIRVYSEATVCRVRIELLIMVKFSIVTVSREPCSTRLVDFVETKPRYGVDFLLPELKKRTTVCIVTVRPQEYSYDPCRLRFPVCVMGFSETWLRKFTYSYFLQCLRVGIGTVQIDESLVFLQTRRYSD